MQVFPEGYTVAYTVPLADLNGAPVAATGVDVSFQTPEGAVLGTISPAVSGTEVEFDVPGSVNTFGAGEDEALQGRVVVVTINTAAGAIERRFVYMVRGAARLAPPVNSFQTLQGALITAWQMGGVPNFDAAGEHLQETALAEAFLRICRISLKVAELEPGVEILPESRRHVTYTYVRQFDWDLVDGAVWEAWPAYFRTALRRAQVAEADHILKGDPVGDKRRAGILSESIGESSMMFRAGFIDLGVSEKTLGYLTGLVHYEVRVSR